MLVRNVMQQAWATIESHAPLTLAIRRAGERGVRHLPVVDAGRLVGIVSDRDLKRAMISVAMSAGTAEFTAVPDRLLVHSVMTRAVVTTGPMVPLEDALRCMIAMRISALPVLDDGRLVGLLTETDGLAALVAAVGASDKASRLEVVVAEGQPANLAEIVASLEGGGARIAGMLTSRPRPGLSAYIFRLLTEDPQPLVRALEAKGHVVRGWTPGECPPSAVLVSEPRPAED